MLNAQEFNTKYAAYKEENCYGLVLELPEVIAYLDEEFQELIKFPEFSYSQIKVKYNWYCFYVKGITKEKRQEIEQNIERIHKENKIV